MMASFSSGEKEQVEYTIIPPGFRHLTADWMRAFCFLAISLIFFCVQCS